MTSPLIPPLWLQTAVGHAERLGRDFNANPLDTWEQHQLDDFRRRGVRAFTAGMWLAMPVERKLRMKAAALPGGVA